MRRPLFGFIALLAVCVACAPSERRVPAQTTATADAPQDGGTLFRRLDFDIVTLNPVLSASKYDRIVAHYLFTPLVYVDRDLRPIPGLADSWTVSEDGLVYRFHINPSATFSDGTPVRARDVVFTLQKLVDPKSEAVQIAGGFEQLDPARTRAVDDRTVDVAFREPLAPQLINFSHLGIVPEHLYSKGNFRNDFNSTAVGSGPYRLVRREANREVVVERRDDYWRAKPHIQTVVFKVIADHGTAFNALKTGDVDETIITSDTWIRERNNPALVQRIEFLKFYQLGYNFIAWNTRHPRLSDPRIRRALGMCVPTEAIVEQIYSGTARPMTGPFTREQWAFNPRVEGVRYDPAQAKRLLESAGWTDTNGDGVLDKHGRRFDLKLLTMAGSAPTRMFAQMVQSELKNIGVNVEIETLDGASAIPRILAGNYEAAYLAWELDPDPDPFAIFHSSQMPPAGQNIVFYDSPVADALIERGLRELDPSKRQQIYHELHEVLAADQPYAWTVQVASKWGFNKRVRGVEVSPGYGLSLWYPGDLGWWIAAGEQPRGRAAQ